MDDLFSHQVDSYDACWAQARWQRLPTVRILTRPDQPPLSFVEPNSRYTALIQTSEGGEVGMASYGNCHLGQMLYVYQIDVLPRYRHKGYALAFLWWLYQRFSLPITPVNAIRASLGFWAKARQLEALGLIINDDMHAPKEENGNGWRTHPVPES